jgi:hypothetical protein
MSRGWRAVAALGLMLAAFSLLATVYLVGAIQDQRRDSVDLLCDLEEAFEDFVRDGPDLPRDTDALERLKELDCDELVTSPPP